MLGRRRNKRFCASLATRYLINAMPRFHFEAVSYSGSTEKGILESDSLQSARQLLLSKQLVPISLSPYQEHSKKSIGSKSPSASSALVKMN